MRKAAVTVGVGLLAGLTLTTAALSGASFAGENGPIVFARGGDLFSIEPDGSGERRLTKGSAAESSPSVSPDGDTVVYVRGKRTGSDVVPHTSAQVWTMRINGKGEKPLTGGLGYASQPGASTAARLGYASQGADKRIFASASPSFSPDGKRIAYQVTEFYATVPNEFVVRHNKIWTMRSDGSRKTLLSKRSDDTRPLFVPDGRIVFFGNSGRNDVYSMRANGKQRELFPELSFRDSDIGFTPSVETVVFASSDRDDSQCTEIYSMQSDGTGVTRLTENAVCDDEPVVSPDTTKLAFARFDGSARCKDGEILIASYDGSNPQPLTEGCSPDWAARQVAR